MSEQPDQATPPAPPRQAAFLIGAWTGIGAIVLAILVAADVGIFFIAIAAIIWLAWGCTAEFVERQDIKRRTVQKTQAASEDYRNRVGKLLQWLSNSLLPETAKKNPLPTSWSDRFNWALTPLARDADDLARLERNPFSWPIHDLAMRMAIAYPLLFVVAQFLVTGEPVTMAAYPLVPEDTAYGWTLAAFGLVVAGLFARILSLDMSKGVFEKLSTWLMLRALPVGLEAGLLFGFGLVIAVGLVVAVGFALAIGLVIAFGLVAALALPGALAVALAISLALVFAGLGVGVFALALALAFALPAVVCALCRRDQRLGQLAYLLLNFYAYLCALTAAIWIPAGDATAVLVIAFALLPTVNALFDWLSYGITILLLSTGHRWQGPWRVIFGGLDLAAAAVLFFALSLALIGTLTLVDSFRAEPLFDLAALLSDIQNGKLADHAWVLAMVASTLLPTLVHLAIGFFSLMTLIRASVWDVLAARMTMEETMGTQLAASLSFGLLRLGFLAVPMGLLFGVVYLLWFYGGVIAGHYATGLIWVTTSLGWLGA